MGHEMQQEETQVFENRSLCIFGGICPLVSHAQESPSVVKKLPYRALHLTAKSSVPIGALLLAG